MKLLIATHNLDKYRIVKGLLLKCNKYLEFCSLKDMNLNLGLEEMGTITDRAKQKAIFFWEYLKDKNILGDIDCVIGVDDGIGLSEADEGNPNSKKLTDAILSRRFVSVGDKVWIKRAYAVIGKNGQAKACMSSIPFVFLGNKTNAKRQKNKYSLSEAFGIVGDNSNLTISKMDFNESLGYYFKYSEKELNQLVQLMTE